MKLGVKLIVSGHRNVIMSYECQNDIGMSQDVIGNRVR